MSNTDYQGQLTQIYNKLTDIQSTLSKLALMSDVNTIQSALQSYMNTISAKLDNLITEVHDLQLTMNDLIIQLRSK